MNAVVPRQRWRTVLGVLGIVFGCFGLLTATQSLLLPMMLEMQRKMFESMSSQAGPGQVPSMFTDLFQPLPAWFTPWCLLVGVVGILVTGFYIFSAVWLLLRKRSAPRWFCSALVASMFLEIVRAVALAIAAGKWGLFMGMGAIFGVVVDLVLLLSLLAHGVNLIDCLRLPRRRCR